MRKNLLLIISVFILYSLKSQVTVSLTSNTTVINPELLGLNGRSTEGPSWTDNTFLSLVSDMNPTWVRYPAGTQGNQWNWKTGTFITSLGLNAKEIFTIPMFVNGLPPNSKIIYMLNMVLPTEQTGITFTTTTDAHLATDATLTAKLTDILNALKAFETAGHLPEVCELGNELYFTNVHAGVYAADPVFYIQHAKIIALAIKNKYPAMKIILCTTKGGTTSRDYWNNTVFNALSTDNQLSAAVYGVVQHHYINETYGDLSAVTNNTIAKTIIDEGISYVQDIATDYAVVPSAKKLWITEYGSTKPSADGMWAAGMRFANMTLSFMKMGPKVDNLLWHHITDDPNILNTAKTKLGPAGIAYMQLSKAMNGCSSYKKLIFSNMIITNEFAGLTGYKFIGNGLETILILNTENNTYSGVNISNLTGNGTVSYAKQYWSSTPYITDVSTSTNISISNSTSLSSYQINPFSITVIQKTLNTATHLIDTDKNIRLFQKNNQLFIEIDANENFRILNTAGNELISGKLNVGSNSIDMRNLSKGILLLRIGSASYKIMCK